MLKTRKKIKKWLHSQGVKNYTIRRNGIVDIHEFFILKGNIKKLPIQFGISSGYAFSCAKSKLKTLEGCPYKVMGNFVCVESELTSLKGCPKYVGEDFRCYNNKLISLNYCPEIIYENFICNNNNLICLKGGPRIVYRHYICRDNKLESFNGLPFIIGRFLSIENNNIKEDELINFYTLIGSEDKIIKCVNITSDFTKNNENFLDKIKMIKQILKEKEILQLKISYSSELKRKRL
ncbi:TPA: hypothetical protein NV714_001715 [Escherichia coli]|nr:hypothetical protein [Escherichia coli]